MNKGFSNTLFIVMKSGIDSIGGVMNSIKLIILSSITVASMTTLLYLVFSVMPVVMVVFIILNIIGLMLMNKNLYFNKIQIAMSETRNNLKVSPLLKNYSMGVYRIYIAIGYTMMYFMLIIFMPYSIDGVWFLPIPEYYFNIGIILVSVCTLVASIVEYRLVRPYIETIKTVITEINNHGV